MLLLIAHLFWYCIYYMRSLTRRGLLSFANTYEVIQESKDI